MRSLYWHNIIIDGMRYHVAGETYAHAWQRAISLHAQGIKGYALV